VSAATKGAHVPAIASDVVDVVRPINGESGEPVVVSSVPESAESVARAATRLYGKAPQAIWIYTDALGAPSFAVARWDEEHGKEIRPLSRVRDGDGAERWAFKQNPAPRPLYNLDLLNASPTAPVVIVEGEKCAEAAGLIFPKSVVTTSSGGSNAAHQTDWSPLRGRPHVLVWGDADAAGQRYVDDVLAILSELDIGEIVIVDANKLASVTHSGVSRSPVPGWDVANALMDDGWEPDLLRNKCFEFATRHEGIPKYLSFHEFTMDAGDGLMVDITKPRGQIETVWLAGPFEVLGRIRDSKGEGWARLLRWRDDDGRVHTHPISDADLHGDPATLCAILASSGLKITTGRNRVHLIRYLNEADVESRVTVVARTGWHEVGGANVFALPNETLGMATGEAVIVQAAMTAPFEKRGSLAEWQSGVASTVAGHSRGVFALSVAFAGPLLGLHGLEGGGFHFCGQSSRGKSTLVEAAASVWGKGAIPGFVRPWRTTANALEGAAAIHSDTLLVLDELGMIDPREAAAAAYQLAAGSGKGRSGRDGSLRASQTWRTMVISTGEVRLSDKLVEGKQKARAGQQVRLIDIPADAGAGFGVFDHAGAGGDAKLLADAIKRAARSAYGTAGPEFVRLLIAHDTDAIAVSAMIEVFRARCVPRSADGQVLRVCDRFGLVAAAGELAREFGIVPWAPGEAIDAAAKCFSDWLDSRGGIEAGEVHAAISQVRLFIEQHGDSRFVDLDDSSRVVFNRAGWRRGHGSDREWLIPPEIWKHEVCAGLDPKIVARELEGWQMLERSSDGFQCVRRIEGQLKRVYVLKPAIIAEEGNE
jgi:putative DNA primase/helicase